MQVVVFVLAQVLVCSLASSTAFARDILYATAASQGRIDGFILPPSGRLDESRPPDVQQSTARGPRRVLTVGCTLYVAEEDRVEAFRIKRGGGLEPRGRTLTEPNTRVSGVTVSPDGRTLYVAVADKNRVNRLPRVMSYRLGSNGAASQTCSCEEDADCAAGPNASAASCMDGRCVGSTGCSSAECATGQTCEDGSCTCRVDADCNGEANSCDAANGRCLGTTRACTAPATCLDENQQQCVFDFSSCALALHGRYYQNLAVAAQPRRLYAAGAGGGTQVDGFALDPDGNILDFRKGTLAERCDTVGEEVGACSCTGPADCDGSEGSCVRGRCINTTRRCTAAVPCNVPADCQTGTCVDGECTGCGPSQTCIAGPTGGTCTCDISEDCDPECDDGTCETTEGTCTLGRCAARACTPSPTCTVGQSCIIDRPPTPAWCQRMNTPRVVVLNSTSSDHVVFLDDRFREKLFAYGINDDTERGRLRKAEDTTEPCAPEDACSCPRRVPKAATVKPTKAIKSRIVSPYETLLIDGPPDGSATGAFTLFASEALRGRVDAYRIQTDVTRPFVKKSPRRSGTDVRMTPVGMAANKGVLYVSGGELDRIRAYEVRDAEQFTGFKFVGQTLEQKGSFPNDVAVAVDFESCPP